MGDPHGREYAIAEKAEKRCQQIGESGRLPERGINSEPISGDNDSRQIHIALGVDHRRIKEWVAGSTLQHVDKPDQEGAADQRCQSPAVTGPA